MRKRQIIFSELVDSIAMKDSKSQCDSCNELILATKNICSIDKQSRYSYYKYSHGYLTSVQVIYNVITDKKTPTIERWHLGYPFLFLCRHTIEITIKSMLNEFIQKFEANHNLLENWLLLEKFISDILHSKNANIALENAKSFVMAFNHYDETSIMNRYPTSKNGESHYNDSISVDAERIQRLLNMFVKQMDVFRRELQMKIYGFRA